MFESLQIGIRFKTCVAEFFKLALYKFPTAAVTNYHELGGLK